MLTSRLLGPLVLCLVGLTALAPVASAVPPEHGTKTLDVRDFIHPRVSALCGFPVRMQYEGWHRTSTFYDQNGEERMGLETGVFHITWSANGKSVRAVLAEPVRAVFNDDGTQTLYFTGVLHRNAPGEGITSGEAGRTVLVGHLSHI